MKKVTLIFTAILLSLATMAQTPQAIKYQTVARNNAGEILASQNITFRMTILQGELPGTVVYTETHAATTNTLGLATLEIGRGTPVTGSFSTINWSVTPIFLKTEIDPAGGSAFVEMGTSELLSVPFALFAQQVAGGASVILLPPNTTTEAATEIVSNSATFNGIVNGEGFSTTVVFDWGTTIDYGNTITATQSPVTGSTDVAVSASKTGLQSATTYHFRTRASNAVNVSYGDDVSFTTIAGVPVLTTNTVTSILALSAVSGGNITYDGGAPVTARGVCWSTNQNPTLGDNFTTDGGGTGSFTSNIAGLVQATTYYVRAYATNAVGTSYGNQRNFTTLTGIILLTTAAVTNITTTTATCGGNITNNGGAPVTARGVCWSLLSNPTIGDNFTSNGTGLGSFTSDITGLEFNYNYFVRAYATNAVGTFYGNEIIFSTGIGAYYQGGIIAYILQPGDPGYVAGETHGLIAAPSDQVTGAEWGCYGTTISGADGTAIGTGYQNTLDIVAGCSTAGIAARICNDLTQNGFDDWFLPSKDELDKLFINMAAIGGFASYAHWSSSEYNGSNAWYQIFEDGSQNGGGKDYTNYVRAVRAF